jgi:hypothetical protein
MEIVTFIRKQRYYVYTFLVFMILLSGYSLIFVENVNPDLNFKYWMSIASGPILIYFLIQEIYRQLTIPKKITFNFEKNHLKINDLETYCLSEVRELNILIKRDHYRFNLVFVNNNIRIKGLYNCSQDISSSIQILNSYTNFNCMKIS